MITWVCRDEMLVLVGLGLVTRPRLGRLGGASEHAAGAGRPPNRYPHPTPASSPEPTHPDQDDDS